MGGMNLENLGASVGHGVAMGGDIGLDTQVVEKPATGAKEPAPILGGDNLTVTTPSTAEAMIRDASFKTAENTIKNLCDTPEERAVKEERAQEEREKEIDEEQVDKAVQEQQMRDEIATEKQEKV